MKVVHIVPQPCIFETVIRRHADALGHTCLFYRVLPRIGMHPRGFLSVYLLCRRQAGSLFVFHKVPHMAILLLSLLIRDFRYALLYWGEDYYSTFLREEEFEAHCVAKSPTLQPTHYQRRSRRFRLAWIQMVLRWVGLVVLRRAAGIVSLCPKQFRILRAFHYRHFDTALRTPQLWIRGYSRDDHASATQYRRPSDARSLTVLVCHSAAATVAHRQTLELLRTYQHQWNAKVHVRGFLSYSGGDEAARERLERELVAQADFAESVHFERSFLSLEDVGDRLKDIDIAVFSCLRDEGVSLLTQFVKLGGVVSFNRFSIDYDFFKAYAPAKLLSHEEFLSRRPVQICLQREQPLGPSPRMLAFEELDKLRLRDGKLVFGSFGNAKPNMNEA